MMIRKKYIIFISMILGTSILFTACNDKTGKNNLPVATTPVVTEQTEVKNAYNGVFEEYNEDITELGLVINSPDDETISSFNKLEIHEYADTKESMIIVPKYNDSKVTISKAEYTGERFIAKETLYTKELTEEGYGLLLYAMRPEGIPEIMVTITHENKSIDYLISEDGKNGNEGIEYLRLKSDDLEINHQSEVVTAIKDEKYLEGLNLFSSFGIDFDLDGKEEKLEVYCQGEITSDGVQMLDDGQTWTLIVKKGDEIYPLFDKNYIQLGGLEYTVYTDYDDYERIHVLFEYNAGAGVIIYDCVYDPEENGFIRTTIHSADNINILKKWNLNN